MDEITNLESTEPSVKKKERKIRVSPKKKLYLAICYIFGFYLGLHAFYAGRFKKGFFYLFSLTGIFSYYAYILYFLMHHWLTSWLHFAASTWFTIYATFNIVIQNIPFLGWTSYFGSYLIFLFIFAVFLVIVDGVAILFGRYKDGNGLKIVTQKYKNKYEQKIVEY